MRDSLIPGMAAGDQNGLFAKPGVSFTKGQTVCRMPNQAWRLSKSLNPLQNPLEQLQGDNDLPEGYIN
jgi:hypothetical protein